MRSSHKQAKRVAGHVDHAILDATTEADIGRQQAEDEVEGEFDLKKARVVVAPEYTRGIRLKLGLTQRAFAERFRLNLRTVEEWEQGRASPDQSTLVLLRVIDHEAEAVDRALSRPFRPGHTHSAEAVLKASPRKVRS